MAEVDRADGGEGGEDAILAARIRKEAERLRREGAPTFSATPQLISVGMVCLYAVLLMIGIALGGHWWGYLINGALGSWFVHRLITDIRRRTELLNTYAKQCIEAHLLILDHTDQIQIVSHIVAASRLPAIRPTDDRLN